MIFLKKNAYLFSIRYLKYWCIICDVYGSYPSQRSSIHSLVRIFVLQIRLFDCTYFFLRFSIIHSVFFIHFILQRRSECSTKRKKYRKRKNAKHEGKSRPTHTHTHTYTLTHTPSAARSDSQTLVPVTAIDFGPDTPRTGGTGQRTPPLYATDAPRSILLNDNDTLMERYYPSTVVIIYRWTRRRGYYIVFEPFLISTYYTDLELDT